MFTSCVIPSDRVALKEKKEVNPFHFITGGEEGKEEERVEEEK